MIRISTTGALLLGLALSACQSLPYRPMAPAAPIAPAPTAMDGNWASSDGVFYASFQGGSFISRFTQTNEILAQGTYTVDGNNVSMQWLSVQAQQQRSANCTIAGSGTVQCNQAGGGSFELTRSA